MPFGCGVLVVLILSVVSLPGSILAHWVWIRQFLCDRLAGVHTSLTRSGSYGFAVLVLFV